MNILKAIILGLIQGLTEFLPVSSSGHLVLGKHLMGFAPTPNPGFEVVVHLGSLLAVLIYFRKDIISLVGSLFCFNAKARPQHLTILWLVIATAVTAVLGFSFKDTLEQLFSIPAAAAGFIALTGVIVYVSDKITGAQLTITQLGWWRSAFIGLLQGVAIIPGVSRSGSTIAGSLFVGLRRQDAARFSFLLSIPAILGAGLIEAKDITTLPTELLLPYAAGAVAAFLSGYAVISMLLALVRQRQLKYFAYYCWVVSAAALIWLLVL